mmetsp:Transcript_47924/g.95338  ORF Transcript_47924/g.95338 Transcript_47924/m.95338 type:complete len:372 (-) Transcript_47924:110-1225(-)
MMFRDRWCWRSPFTCCVCIFAIFCSHWISHLSVRQVSVAQFLNVDHADYFGNSLPRAHHKPSPNVLSTAGTRAPRHLKTWRQAIAHDMSEYFRHERQNGLYDMGKTPQAWTTQEGITARTPRIGFLDKHWHGGETPFDVFKFLQSEAKRGALVENDELCRSTQGRLNAFASIASVPRPDKAGWFSFGLNVATLSESDLASLTLTPPGWDTDIERATYMEHIVTFGCQGKAMIGGGHVFDALHYDTSPDRYYLDTMLCGAVGKKRVICLAPDHANARKDSPWKPDANSDLMKPIAELPAAETWAALEDVAQSDHVSGAVVDLLPGQFIFLPHGWWHAVRPLDTFTVITGPGRKTDFQVALDPGLGPVDGRQL